METGYAFYVHGHFVKRGFLFGPICPIYGFGAVILYCFFSKYKNNNIKLFFLSALVCSFFEYIAGFALEALFCERWWDYTGEFLNLNGRISIFYSFVWGVIAILFVNHIHPFIEEKVNRFFNKIPILAQNISTKLLYIILLSDFFLSCLKHLGIFIVI